MVPSFIVLAGFVRKRLGHLFVISGSQEKNDQSLDPLPPHHLLAQYHRIKCII